jgi:hypothetical protein
MDCVATWLLEGDPAIRWQAMRDLTDARTAEIDRVRRQVAETGWGAETLGAQDAEGTWGGGLYTPKWTSTTYTLLLLRRFGTPPDTPACRRGAQHLLDQATWLDGGVSYWKTKHQAEVCVNGMVLSIAAYFRLDDPRLADIADLLLRSRFVDGGWNCDERPTVHHSSFNTTISVLEGLLEYQRSRPEIDADVDAAIAEGHRFLADHRLFRSCRSDDVIDPRWKRFSFPPRWHYDVLRGLDHLRDAGAAPASAFTDGIDLVRSKESLDGTWKLENRHRGREHFVMEPGGAPSRWNTLRARRVLRWWEG